MSNPARPEETLFLTMDGMRGVGAVLVVIGHCLMFWGGAQVQTQLLPYLVDMFFLLSGFVIAYAFEPRIRRGMSVGGFMLQRIIRLYPIYLVGILMGLAVHIIAWMDDGEDIGRIALEVAPQLFMLPSLNTHEASIFTLDGPAWSLFFELFANLFYVLIFRFLSMRVLIAVVGVFAVLMIASSCAYGDFHVGWSQQHILGGFPRAGFGFFAGVTLYRLAGSPAKAPRTRSLWAWLLLAAPLLPAMISVPDAFKTPAYLLGAFVFGPLMIWGATRIQPPRFTHRLMEKAGAISYAVYMLHFPMFAALERLEWSHPGMLTGQGAWIGAGLLAATIVIAWLMDRYYDLHVRRWINRQLKARAAGPEMTGPPFVAG